MHKYLTTLGILLFTSTLSAQVNIIFSENFNQGIPSSWSMIDADQATPYNDPSVVGLYGAFHALENIDSTGIGDTIVAATSWFTDTTSANNFLISPSIQLGNTGNYLYFDAKSTDASYPDGVQIRYTYNHINVDSIMQNEIIFDTVAVPPFWTNFKVKLDSNLNGALINFAFRHYASNQFILELDNIRVESNDLTTIQSSYDNSNMIYPNPTKNMIKVIGLKNGNQYEIFNINGLIIKSGIYNESIKLDYPSGLYFLKYGTIVDKFIIR